MPLHVDVQIELVTTPCGTCWGQRQILEEQPDGTWDVLRCNTCLGVGEITRTTTTLSPQEHP